MSLPYNILLHALGHVCQCNPETESCRFSRVGLRGWGLPCTRCAAYSDISARCELGHRSARGATLLLGTKDPPSYVPCTSGEVERAEERDDGLVLAESSARLPPPPERPRGARHPAQAGVQSPQQSCNPHQPFPCDLGRPAQPFI